MVLKSASEILRFKTLDLKRKKNGGVEGWLVTNAPINSIPERNNGAHSRSRISGRESHLTLNSDASTVCPTIHVCVYITYVYLLHIYIHIYILQYTCVRIHTMCISLLVQFCSQTLKKSFQRGYFQDP